MLKFEKNKGITLVALIITIIILLILAGITIGQLTGNGIFENAKTAKEKYENAQKEEQEILNSFYVDSEVASTRTTDSTIEELERKINSLQSQINNLSDRITVDYSEEEKVIGTWTNGEGESEQLWQRTFHGTTPSNSSYIELATNSNLGIDKLIEVSGAIAFRTSDTEYGWNDLNGSGSGMWIASGSSKNLGFWYNDSSKGQEYFVTIKYIKIKDSET